MFWLLRIKEIGVWQKENMSSIEHSGVKLPAKLSHAVHQSERLFGSLRTSLAKMTRGLTVIGYGAVEKERRGSGPKGKDVVVKVTLILNDQEWSYVR